MIPAIPITPRATPTARPATAPLLRPFDETELVAPCPRGELSAVAVEEGVMMTVEI